MGIHSRGERGRDSSAFLAPLFRLSLKTECHLPTPLPNPGEDTSSPLSPRIQCWSPLDTPSAATPIYDTLPVLWDSLSPAKSTQSNHHSNQRPACGRRVMCVHVVFNRIKSSSISSLDKQMANPLSAKTYLSVSSLGIGLGLPSPAWSHLVLTASPALTGCSVNGDRM